MSDKENIMAGEIMTEHVIMVKSSTTIKDLAHLMLRDRISGVPIIDENGNIVGLVTTTDLYKALDNLMLESSFGKFTDYFKKKPVSVEQIMTTDVITFPKNTPIDDIITLSIERNIHTFPIVDGKKIVGIIGKRDILNAGFAFAI